MFSPLIKVNACLIVLPICSDNICAASALSIEVVLFERYLYLIPLIC
jgi:hypothetical protein